jgi:hypothetical protein
MTLERVKKYLDEWEIDYADEQFFSEFNCVSFIIVKNDRRFKVYVFKHEIWELTNTVLEPHIKIHSFTTKTELGVILKQLGFEIPTKAKKQKLSAIKRFFSCM